MKSRIAVLLAASFAPLVRRHAEGSDPLLAEHARWALNRLGGAPAAAPAPTASGPG